MHACIHVCMHTHMQIHKRTYLGALPYMHAKTGIHECKYAYCDAYITNTHIICYCTYTYLYACKYMYPYSCMPVYSNAHHKNHTKQYSAHAHTHTKHQPTHSSFYRCLSCSTIPSNVMPCRACHTTLRRYDIPYDGTQCNAMHPMHYSKGMTPDSCVCDHTLSLAELSLNFHEGAYLRLGSPCSIVYLGLRNLNNEHRVLRYIIA